MQAKPMRINSLSEIRWGPGKSDEASFSPGDEAEGSKVSHKTLGPQQLREVQGHVPRSENCTETWRTGDIAELREDVEQQWICLGTERRGKPGLESLCLCRGQNHGKGKSVLRTDLTLNPEAETEAYRRTRQIGQGKTKVQESLRRRVQEVGTKSCSARNRSGAGGRQQLIPDRDEGHFGFMSRLRTAQPRFYSPFTPGRLLRMKWPSRPHH